MKSNASCAPAALNQCAQVVNALDCARQTRKYGAAIFLVTANYAERIKCALEAHIHLQLPTVTRVERDASALLLVLQMIMLVTQIT